MVTSHCVEGQNLLWYCTLYLGRRFIYFSISVLNSKHKDFLTLLRSVRHVYAFVVQITKQQKYQYIYIYIYISIMEKL